MIPDRYAIFLPMVSKDDKKAALILVGLAMVGLVVRVAVGGDATPGAVLYQGDRGDTVPRDSLAAQATRLGMPLLPGEKVDVDVASVAELTRLPRIGPGLAGRILSDRDLNGSFGSLDGLGRVSGVGSAVLDAVAPFAVFSGRPHVSDRRTGGERVRINLATAEQLAALPGIGIVKARSIVEDRTTNGRYRTVDELARVRGIGAATVERLRPLVVVP